MCRAPYFRTAASTMSRALPSAETSPRTKYASPPFSCTMCMVCTPPSSFTSLRATLAPSAAKRTAATRPWPLAPPVIKATLPSSLPAIDLPRSPVVLERRTLPAAERLLEMLRHRERHILPPGAGHHLHTNRQPLRRCPPTHHCPWPACQVVGAGVARTFAQRIGHQHAMGWGGIGTRRAQDHIIVFHEAKHGAAEPVHVFEHGRKLGYLHGFYLVKALAQQGVNIHCASLPQESAHPGAPIAPREVIRQVCRALQHCRTVFFHACASLGQRCRSRAYSGGRFRRR